MNNRRPKEILLFVSMRCEKAKPAVAKKAVLRAASEMKWVDIPDAKGAQQAVAWGNPQKGAHASFANYPGHLLDFHDGFFQAAAGEARAIPSKRPDTKPRLERPSVFCRHGLKIILVHDATLRSRDIAENSKRQPRTQILPTLDALNDG